MLLHSSLRFGTQLSFICHFSHPFFIFSLKPFMISFKRIFDVEFVETAGNLTYILQAAFCQSPLVKKYKSDYKNRIITDSIFAQKSCS